MSKSKKKMGALVAALALTTGGLVAVGMQSASAAGCYDSAVSFAHVPGEHRSPSGGGKFTATSACNDINLRTGSSIGVKVCFYPRSGKNYCQTEWTSARAGQWTVVATDVRPGTKFELDWYHSGIGFGAHVAS